MHLRTLLVTIVLGLMAVFAAANWGAFIAPMTLSLLFATVEAPLGLIMLGFTVLLTLLFLLFVAYMQATLLMDTRRQARELQAQKALAEQAEASRIAELRGYLEAVLPKLAEDIAGARAAAETRLDRLEGELRSVVEQTGNTLAAYIGELEDRLERDPREEKAPPPPDPSV